jgi:hypothetical protein
VWAYHVLIRLVQRPHIAGVGVVIDYAVVITPYLHPPGHLYCSHRPAAPLPD